RTATVNGQKVTVREGVWQGREAATPAKEAAMRQRSEDSASGGAAGIGVSKPEGSGTTGQTFEPTFKVDELSPFRRFAGETVVTHFGGEDQDQTTVLPTVSGVCDKTKEHPSVHLCFFITDTTILINQKKCPACP
ncbi:unnamed protein product, partial [Ectocarpus sp. 4 AP-2014]